MEEERDGLIVLVDEDGEEVEFEHLDTIEMDEKEYVILIPYQEDEGENAEELQEEVVILRIEHGAEGEDSFVSIEDEHELNQVFEEFKNRADEDFDFE